MELELGLKLTRVADEFTSDFQISKDRAGPLFVSQETDSMFILTAHLKGYKRGNINIDINEDGTLIAISGQRQVKETVMVGWKLYKKDSEIKGFKKVFRIPDMVILDKIKAKYNEDESTLKISMPKKVKGIRGTAIEEVKEMAELVQEGSGNLQILDGNIQRTETSDQEKDEVSGARHERDENEVNQMQQEEKSGKADKPVSGDSQEGETQAFHYSKEEEKGQQDNVHEEDFNRKEQIEETKCLPSIQSEAACAEIEMPKQMENQKTVDDTRGKIDPKHYQELDHAEYLGTKQLVHNENNHVHEKASDILKEKEDEEADTTVKQHEEVQEAEAETVQDEERKPRSKRCKMCTPIVAGSVLLMSFVVFVIHIIRNKNQASRRRD